jgi:hypothetical protein
MVVTRGWPKPEVSDQIKSENGGEAGPQPVKGKNGTRAPRIRTRTKEKAKEYLQKPNYP